MKKLIVVLVLAGVAVFLYFRLTGRSMWPQDLRCDFTWEVMRNGAVKRSVMIGGNQAFVRFVCYANDIDEEHGWICSTGTNYIGNQAMVFTKTFPPESLAWPLTQVNQCGIQNGRFIFQEKWLPRMEQAVEERDALFETQRGDPKQMNVWEEFRQVLKQVLGATHALNKGELLRAMPVRLVVIMPASIIDASVMTVDASRRKAELECQLQDLSSRPILITAELPTASPWRWVLPLLVIAIAGAGVILWMKRRATRRRLMAQAMEETSLVPEEQVY